MAGATPWHPHHIAERYGLFFIIVLGETVLSVALALQVALDKENPPAALAAVIAGGVLITFCAWWLYFNRDDSEVLTGNDVGFVWGFGHYVIFGSVAAFGAGLAARVEYYEEHAKVSDIVSSAFVSVPVAAFLAASWFLCVRLHDASARTAVPVRGGDRRVRRSHLGAVHRAVGGMSSCPPCSPSSWRSPVKLKLLSATRPSIWPWTTT